MGALKSKERIDLRKALLRIGIDAAPRRMEAFVGDTLGWSVAERGMRFTVDGVSSIAAEIGALRESVLRIAGNVPEYVIYKAPPSAYTIAGTRTYLRTIHARRKLIDRLHQHLEVRKALIAIQNGHHLEALTAAILESQLKYGSATQGSGDQGIDAIGWASLLRVERSFCIGNVEKVKVLPGEQVFVLASAKANVGRRSSKASVLIPAHVRELIGGWLIQRTERGMWRKHGLRMLTPMQMILATTYKLSEDAKGDCQELGVQIWSLPELTFFVCAFAPDSVFDAADGFKFSRRRFKDWWKPHQLSRITAKR